MKVNLHTLLKSSYGDKNSNKQLENQGYQLDRELSNDNQQFYYNKKKGKLINTIAGTHNIRDVGTDIWLGAGKLNQTSRFKEAERRLESAKQKYKPSKTVITGHSLGGSIAQNLSSKGDKTVSLDSGYTLGQKTRGESYRSQGDAVSLLGSNAKHQNTIQHGNIITRNSSAIVGGLLGGPVGAFVGAGVDAIKNHNVDLIKHKNIFV
jgi:hypothetical protein